MFNPPTLYYSDGYKPGHKAMLAKDTLRMYGTWVPRNLKRAPKGVTKVLSIGQQLTARWLHDEFEERFFKMPKEVAVKFGEDMSLYLGLPYDASHFEALHDLGYLPLRLKSLPEGVETPANVPHMTFFSTLDGFAWLTLYVETILSSLSWKTPTSGSIGLQYKRNLVEWVMRTDPDNAFLIPYLAHDFSARGLDPFSMLASGLGHAASFRGSDSLIVIPGARYFYGEPEGEVCINSVNASEHSVSTTKIFTVGEERMMVDWLTDFPKGIFSMVADTFDLTAVVKPVQGGFLFNQRELIMKRDGKLVIRPDCYDDQTEILTQAGWKLFKSLNQTDLVAQYWNNGSEQGSIDFVQPSKVVNEQYDGDMVRFRSDYYGQDLLVTPNHRMGKRHKYKGNEFAVSEAADLKLYDGIVLPQAGIKRGGTERALTPLEKLYVAFQADGRKRGHDGNRPNGGKYILEFGFSKQRKIEKLLDILTEGEFEYKMGKPVARPTKNRAHSEYQPIYVYMDRPVPSSMAEWVDFANKSHEWCADLISEAGNWDATVRDANRVNFGSTSEGDISVLQTAATLAGFKTVRKVVTDRRGHRDSYLLYVMRNKDYIQAGSIEKSVEQYSGTVHCVTVPSGMVVVRRNGNVLISGNSGDPVEIICGHGRTHVTDEERRSNYPEFYRKGLIECLWEIFGGTTNKQGYKVLDPHIGAIYGDSITLERQVEIYSRLAAKGFATTNIVLGIGSYCVHPDTLILLDDLSWARAGDLKPGQGIISFTEYPKFHNDRRAVRVYERATIEFNIPAIKPSVVIYTDHGSIQTSDDHPFLIFADSRSPETIYFNGEIPNDRQRRDIPRGKGLAWKKACDLCSGDRIAFFSKPWEVDKSYDAGWYAGIFDGEGNLSKQRENGRIPGRRVSISQNLGSTLDRIISLTKKFGFDYHLSARRDNGRVVRLRGGWRTAIRFLGVFRPVRPMSKLDDVLLDMPALKQNYTYDLATIERVEFVGDQSVASIRTSNGTFITNGFLSHNTYQYNTRDTLGWAAKGAWFEVLDADDKRVGYVIYKDPVTDDGAKRSLHGLVCVTEDFRVLENCTWEQEGEGILRTIYEDGRFSNLTTLTEIRARVDALASVQATQGVGAQKVS